MPPEALARTVLEGDVAAAIAALPARAGVGQLLGPERRVLLTGTASNLRRWTASHLGLLPARRSKAGRAPRPRTSLAGLATEIVWLETDGPFAQRLAYERLSALQSPPPARPDLKPPFFVHLDPRERFPRASVRPHGEGALYGPFRDRRAAEKARDALQRAFALRPCDFSFEPDPQLPLGLGCLYAQVRSCAAPCLARVTEDAYRARAASAADWLADPDRREEAPAAVPASVASASGRAVVVDSGKRRVRLYPLRAGRVVEAAVVETDAAGLSAAAERLAWPQVEGPSDWPWLTAWLASPKRRASFVAVPERWSPAALAGRLREAVEGASRPRDPGDNVGSSREEP